MYRKTTYRTHVDLDSFKLQGAFWVSLPASKLATFTALGVFVFKADKNHYYFVIVSDSR